MVIFRKLQIGKRNKETDLSERSPIRRRRSVVECSVVYEEVEGEDDEEKEEEYEEEEDDYEEEEVKEEEVKEEEEKEEQKRKGIANYNIICFDLLRYVLKFLPSEMYTS